MVLSWQKNAEPKNKQEIIGQDTVILHLEQYITTYVKQKKKFCILLGPPGIGKSVIVQIIAEQLGFEFVELNASDERNASEINERLYNTLNQRSLFGKGKLILLDEIDGISGTGDRGGLGAILELAATSTYPIIITANDLSDHKFSSLRSKGNIIPCESLSHLSITRILRSVCEQQGVTAAEDALSDLARRSGGDARAAINDLQTLSQSTKQLTREMLQDLPERDRTESVSHALVKIFKSKDVETVKNAFDLVDEEPRVCYDWIVENVIQEYHDVDTLVLAYESLSISDIFYGRIRRWQYWRFLVYSIALHTVGVSLAKKEKTPGFMSYRQPQRGLTIWRLQMKNAVRKSIAQHLSPLIHSSVRATNREIIPYFLRMAQTEAFRTNLQNQLTDEQLAWLGKS